MQSKLMPWAKGLLLAIPALSVMSASVYFSLLSAEMSFLPAQIFDLQDHFNKAVDLLVPVFLGTILTALISGRLLFMKPSEAVEPLTLKAIVSIAFYVVLGIILTFIYAISNSSKAYVILIFLSLLIVMFGAARFFQTSLFNKYVVTSGFKIIWGLLVLTALGAYLYTAQERALERAVRAHYASDERVLVDKFSIGILIIEDRKFKIEASDGRVIAEGAPINPIKKTIACSAGVQWTCRHNKDFRSADR